MEVPPLETALGPDLVPVPGLPLVSGGGSGIVAGLREVPGAEAPELVAEPPLELPPEDPPVCAKEGPAAKHVAMKKAGTTRRCMGASRKTALYPQPGNMPVGFRLTAAIRSSSQAPQGR